MGNDHLETPAGRPPGPVTDDSEWARSLYIHDFVRVDLPFDAVVGAFTHFVDTDLIRRLVAMAWTDESGALAAALANRHREDPHHPSEVAVHFGQPRVRRDAVVVPVRWATCSERWVPPLEADLEIVGFGPYRSHLHVLGRSQLQPQTAQFTDRASLEHRLAVAVVRHVLRLLADAVTSGAGSRPGAQHQTSSQQG